MSDPEDREHEASPPVRPQFQFLEYQSPPTHPTKPLPMDGGQIAIGFACWVFSVAVAAETGNVTRSPLLAFIMLGAVIIPCSIYFQGTRGYRGFFPGVLIGAALTCLLPLGIAGILCWGQLSHI